MERLQKIISSQGIMSRRSAEKAILEGRVYVNGKIALLGQQADIDKDIITVDGNAIKRDNKNVYIMLNKPCGYVSTLSDENGRKTVAELVSDCGTRVYPVGRLDLNSEGLLLMTNDGALTQRLTHPSHNVEKEYLVRISGDIENAIPKFKQKMLIDGIEYLPAKVRILSEDSKSGTFLLSFVIHQGKNRQIRRMCSACNLTVHRLKRVREDVLTLGNLQSGSWRYLSDEEINGICNK